MGRELLCKVRSGGKEASGKLGGCEGRQLFSDAYSVEVCAA